MEQKRVTLFAGHYGSGKTNIAVNYALYLKKLGHQVNIADLDIVNPYFRTKDSARELKAAGIDLISPQYANSNVDLPALPAEAYRIVEDKSSYSVVDIGGDDRGAYALGRYVPALLQEQNYRMVFVANFYRPLTQTVDDAIQVMREIEEACGLKFTDIVNNSNLGSETTADTVLDTIELAKALQEKARLPLLMHTVRADLAEDLKGKLSNVFPLTLQKKYFDLPSQKI